MRIPYAFLFLFILSTWTLNAQTVSSKEITYEIGTPYPVVDAQSKDYFERNGTVITVKVRKKDIVIQKLDAASLKFQSVRIYNDLPKDFVQESILQIQGRLYYFYSVWDRSKETEQLFYREIDFEKGTFTSSGKILVKVRGKVTGTLAQKGFSIGYSGISVVDKFDLYTSADESKVLVKYRKKPKKRNDDISHDVIGFHVFDQSLEKLWSKEARMPYTEKKMNNLDYAVDAFGNGYMMTTVYLDNSTKLFKKDGSSNYRMELLKIDATSNELSKHKIGSENKFVTGVAMYEASKGEIICAGYYNDDGRDESDAKGVFTTRLNNDGALEPLSTYEIPLEVLNQYVSKSRQTKNSKGKGGEFRNLEVRNLITDDQGGVVIIGEQYYLVSNTTAFNNSTSTSFTYYYNDILITRINPDGTLEYMRKLPKQQRGTAGKGGLSFQYFFKNGFHYMLYLDHIENLDAPMDSRLPGVHRDGAGGYLTAYRVDDLSGEVDKISILNMRDVPQVKSKELYQFSVNRILNLSEDEFVIEFYKKKKEDVLVKFSIN